MKKVFEYTLAEIMIACNDVIILMVQSLCFLAITLHVNRGGNMVECAIFNTGNFIIGRTEPAIQWCILQVCLQDALDPIVVQVSR